MEPATAPAARARHTITPRSPKFDYSEVPRYWMGDNPIGTHMANGVNLLFPLGERFFIRSVNHYADTLDDPELREQVKGFFAQEARHGAAHQDHSDVLRAQGYEIDRFLALYDRVAWKVVEPAFPPAMRLAVTAALEHYTAIMAEGALAFGTLDVAHPQMQALLKWHAAEEIEHKSVAFDVLQTVNPSYALRMGGMAIATVGLVAFWSAATLMLLRQDARAGRRVSDEQRAQFKEFQKERPVLREVFVNGLKQYFRRGFHPSQNDNLDLAYKHLADVAV